jgi:signal transduction histidine kinase
VAALPPLIQDAILAVALALVYVATLLPYRSQLHPQAAAFTLVVLESLPLVWRRTWPVAVFLVIGIARVAYDRVPLGFAPLPLGPAIAYFTVIDRCSMRVRCAVTVVVLAGIISSQVQPGHTEPYDFSVAVLVFVAAGMAGVLSRTRRAFLAEVESRAARAEAQRDGEAALAAAAERTRIARELHDVVAHHVSLMAVQAEAAASLLPGHPDQARRSVEIIGATARQALAEMRRLLGVLRGPAEHAKTAPSASLADLQSVLAQVREAGLRVHFRVEGTPCQLAPGIDLTAYRIVQEALTNTIKHAQATEAAVTLSYEPGYITVSVADSGPSPTVHGTLPGPDPGRLTVSSYGDPTEPGPPDHAGPAAGSAGQVAAGGARLGRSGLGLAGIAERVASCAGRLTIGPNGSGGFEVTARLPAL